MTRLERDVGCTKNLLWRAELPTDATILQLEAGLEANHFKRRDTNPLVLIFDNQARHQVVVVPRTRRVQIRVDFEINVDERPSVAETIWQDVLDAISRED